MSCVVARHARCSPHLDVMPVRFSSRSRGVCFSSDPAETAFASNTRGKTATGVPQAALRTLKKSTQNPIKSSGVCVSISSISTSRRRWGHGSAPGSQMPLKVSQERLPGARRAELGLSLGPGQTTHCADISPANFFLSTDALCVCCRIKKEGP